MSKKDKFVQVMVDIAEDNSHGYSQVNRWPSELGGKNKDFDCSSLVYWAAHEAGYDVTLGPAGTHYTGTIIQDFTKAGFRNDAFDGNLNDLEPGDILLNVSNHVAVYIGGGKLAEASIDEVGGIRGPKQGDQTGHEIHVRSTYNYPWTNVLTPPAEKASTTSSSKTTTKTTSSKTLNGIDVSSNQPANICSRVPLDFAIVKMSGNPQTHSWDYVNPYAKQQADDAYKRTGCVGLYHFTWGKDAVTEADFFVDQVRKLGYIGKAVLVIDYEAQAVSLGRSWVKKFADRVKAKSGVAPVIYASGSVVVSQNLFGLGYPIWTANYYRGYNRVNGYTYDKNRIYDGCESSVLWQYTSQGYLSGYDGPLDLDVFFGSKSDWQKLAGGKEEKMELSDECIKKIAKETAHEVLWGWQDVGNGNTKWTLGGAVLNAAKDCAEAVWTRKIVGTKAEDRFYGMDCAANEAKTFAKKIWERVSK